MSLNRITVLGVGNTLLRDDGIGPRVITQLQPELGTASDVQLLDGGTLSFSLLPSLMDSSAWIIIDGTQLGIEPGTIRCFEGEAMDTLLRCGRRSVHEVGIADLLDMARLLDVLPLRRLLLTIQVMDTAMGALLSPHVERAVPHAATMVVKIVQQWRTDLNNE